MHIIYMMINDAQILVGARNFLNGNLLGDPLGDTLFFICNIVNKIVINTISLVLQCCQDYSKRTVGEKGIHTIEEKQITDISHRRV